jgi:hypothetical protein
LHEEEEKWIEEFLQWRETVEHTDEEYKELMIKASRVGFISRMFKQKEDWKK